MSDTDDTRERMAEDLALVLRREGVTGWLAREPLPLARAIIASMLEVTVCDVWEDNVRGDIGGPCRKLRGHDGDHDPFERVTPDSLRESFGLPPVDLPYTPDYGPAHRLEAPMRPAPNHPIWTLDVATLDYVVESLVGIWTVEPDLLIESAIADVRAIRGFASSGEPRPVAAVAAEDQLLSLVDDQLSHHDYKEIATWLTAIKDAAYDAGWDAAMREAEAESVTQGLQPDSSNSRVTP